ncbi:MAG: Gx transporter family protein [Clostridia bacterium]|nr:Gx transporter family protein [Clostridia bacterium]MDD4048339.1 Gx transporter family protein [Clostridia bacterium]
MVKTQKLVYLSLLVTVATALGFIEMMMPYPMPIPGIKLGLANIVTLLVIYLYGLKEGITVSLLRVFFVSFLAGTFLSVSFFLSLSGAILSTLIMSFLKRYVVVFSIIGISIAGALAHNIGQVLMVILLIKTKYVIFYLPILLITGLPTGLITGYIAKYLLSYLKNTK